MSPAGPAGGPAPPSPEELAAIVAAVEALWPRPPAAAPPPEPVSRAWRFSGRWWAPAQISRGDRPWVRPTA